MAGQASTPQAALVMLPYRLVLASYLAEHGLVEAASQQASAVTAALNALGGKLPGGLLRTRMQANELVLRLQKHAQVRSIPRTARSCHRGNQLLIAILHLLSGQADLRRDCIETSRKLGACST